MDLNKSLYRSLCRIRKFEETVLANFPRGIFYGTTHVYLGQEANAVGVLYGIQENDIVFSNHRCHGHFIAYGVIPVRYLLSYWDGQPVCAEAAVDRNSFIGVIFTQMES